MLRRKITEEVGGLRKTRLVEMSQAGKIHYANKQLGVAMHQWHAGMGDPIYAVGSLIYAGHDVEREDAEDAIDSLETLLHTAKGADKRQLKATIAALKKGLMGAREAVEPGDTELSEMEARTVDDEIKMMKGEAVFQGFRAQVKMGQQEGRQQVQNAADRRVMEIDRDWLLDEAYRLTDDAARSLKDLQSLAKEERLGKDKSSTVAAARLTRDLNGLFYRIGQLSQFHKAMK